MNLILALSFGLFACGDKEEDSGVDGDTYIAQELWGEMNDLQSWNQLPDWAGVVASNTAHGDFVQIWLNTEAFDALSNNQEIPNGGIIVKESFSDAEGTQLNNYTVMKKISGYNPEGADWFWAKFGTEGSIDVAGNATLCTGCHSSTESYIQFTSVN